MAEYRLNGIGIKGICCAVPKMKVDNTEFYEVFGEENVENFIKMTGVRSTYKAIREQTASDLCYIAAMNLLAKKGIDPEEIGACIFVSQTPDYRIPATACVLHKRLGLKKDCVAFDVNLGCSGWTYGVYILGSLMQSSNITKALLLFGDTIKKNVAPLDKSAVMLFGDAGSATLLEKDPNSVLFGEMMTDGAGFKAIITPSGAYRNTDGSYERTQWQDGNVRSDYDLVMNGTDVFSFTITQVPKMIKTHLNQTGEQPDGYDAVVLHQANLFILQQISKKTKFPMDKIPVSIDRYGNTSGTSIPLTLCDSYGLEENSNLRLLLCGFGVGLSWGLVEASIRSEDIFPIVFSDDYYDEGGVTHD